LPRGIPDRNTQELRSQPRFSSEADVESGTNDNEKQIPIFSAYWMSFGRK
jgi:hypothetical protein